MAGPTLCSQTGGLGERFRTIDWQSELMQIAPSWPSALGWCCAGLPMFHFHTWPSSAWAQSVTPPPPPPPVSLPACLSALWFMRKQKSGQDWNKQIGFYLNCRRNFKRTPGHVNKSFHEDCVNLAHVTFCYVRHRDVSNTLMLLASQIKKKKRSVSRQCYSSTAKHIFWPSKCPDHKWTSTSTVQSL